MSKPQLVILPGAWHVPLHYAAITSKLEAQGYKVYIRQFPSVGNPKPPTDLSEDIAAAKSLVEEAIGDGNDVVVIPHSWAGIVAGSALDGMGKKEREAEGKKGGVVRAGYIAAFMVDKGVGLIDCIPGPADWWDVQGAQNYATDPKIFYNDLPEAEQKHWHSQCQSHAIATKYAKATAASWKQIPTSYLLCELDQAIPWQGQEAMSGAAKAAGAEVEVTRMNSGHSPFLSKPEETVEWIRKVAGEKL